MSQIIKQGDGSLVYKLYMPLELRQIDEKVKGTERTLAEWWDHINEKAAYADGDLGTDRELIHTQHALRDALAHGSERIDAFEKAAGKYMAEALIESMEKGVDHDGIIENLDSKIKSLAGKLKNTLSKYKAPGRGHLGQCLLFYIEENQDVPRNRKDLELFSKSVLRNGIAERTISKHLEWYGLEKICRTHQQ